MVKRFVTGSMGLGVTLGMVLTAYVGTPVPVARADTTDEILHRITQDTVMDSIAASNAEEERYRRSIG